MYIHIIFTHVQTHTQNPLQNGIFFPTGNKNIKIKEKYYKNL